MEKKKIIVAMSGGVDSSVAALLLKKAGHEVVGMTMDFGINYEPNQQTRQCSAPESVIDAKKVCDMLGIPHYAIDKSSEMKKYVIDPFVEEYTKGRTPNPCVRCNQNLKFGAMLKKVEELGFDAIATGHYAKITKDDDGYHLEAAEDKKKDQTYFLYGVKKEDLSKIIFPVYGMEKSELRKIAEEAKLPVAQKKESQDICFVPGGNYRVLLDTYNIKQKSGNIIDKNGKILGSHSGVENFTIGQRKGLGVAIGRPQYVTKIDIKSGDVTIGDKEDLEETTLFISNVNYLESLKGDLSIKIRSTMSATPCTVEQIGDNLKVTFVNPQYGVCAGQSAVIYNGDRVVAGGLIETSI